MTQLVRPEAVEKWNAAYAEGSNKRYPNLDLVRLDAWFFKQPGTLLEYGFGCGVNLIHMLERGHKVEALDASTSARKIVEEKLAKRDDLQKQVNLHTIKVGDEQLPFPDESFDFVTCVSVLSLLGSREAVTAILKEFRRVLKPGGKLIVDINTPQSDFAMIHAEHIGDYVYMHSGMSGKEVPHPCWCPPGEDFAETVGQVFEIDTVGYSAHKYFDREINEALVCAHKP